MGHAKLSPSSAERWIACPGSVALIERAATEGIDVDRETVYAGEGTLAHTVAEIKAGAAYGLLPETVAQARLRVAKKDAEANGWDFEEMLEHARDYVSRIDALTDGRENAQLLTEQRVNTGIVGCWGTADAAVIGTDGVLDVVDYKYGVGVLVSPVENPQEMLYALGVLDMIAYLDEIVTVRLHIHQPRARTGATFSSWEISADELRAWREEVARPQAALALSGDGYLAASEKGCRWCPIAGQCRTRMEYVTKRSFGDPDLLTPEELGEVHGQLDDIDAWTKSVRETSLRLAYDQGVQIPGWKVVRSGGRRQIQDEKKFISRLRRAGFGSRQTTKAKLLTLGELEKLVGGKRVLNELAGPTITMSEGRESLVPTDDARPGVTAAAEAAAVFNNDESE